MLAVSAHFLRPPATGPAEAEIEVLHEGRSVSTVRAALRQDGQTCVEALVTLGHLDETGAVVARRPRAARGGAARGLHPGHRGDRGVRGPAHGPARPPPRPGEPGLDGGQADRPRRALGRLALLDEPGFDPLSLLVAVDAFPPATFDVEVSGWVPTIQLSAYVRARPADGPVVVRHRAQVITQGRVDESTTVWDRNGAVVAQATQLAGIRLGSRP